MKTLKYLSLFCFLVSFISCTCDGMDDESKNIIGLWKHQNKATYLDENGNLKPIVTEIDIMSNNTYTANTIGLSFPLFNFPKVDGEWSYESSDRKIKFFQRSRSGEEIIEESSIFWQIRNLNDTLIDVTVSDYKGVFLQDIIYKK